MQLSFDDSAGRRVELAVEADESGGWRVRLPDGSERQIQAERRPGDTLRIAAGDRTFEVSFARKGDTVSFSHGGKAYAFEPARGPRGEAKKTGSGVLVAPMVGLVTDVLVSAGEVVRAYQPLVVIEAMKVLATLEAPFAGTVKQLHVAKGDQVSHGAPIVEVTAK